jgi:hypothetical protein
VRMPYRVIATWLDGKATTELAEIKPNVAMDAAKFSRPGPK